ncbi:AAA family ATPase [Neobacillus niacini]|uniref:AAA family ATPase n=1 Tax=Neobacillus niacini TaxID=86668 RepID=UPI0039831762
MRKKVVLISGPSGAGKSTLRLKLRKQLGERLNFKVAGIDIDDVYCFVDPLFAAPNYMELWQLARRNSGYLTNILLQSEMDVVFVFGNTIFSKEQVMEVLHEIELNSDITIFHISLNPKREALEARLKARQYSVPKWLDSHLEERKKHLTEDWTTLLDTTSLTPEETLESIYHLIAKEENLMKIFTKNNRSN